MTRKPVGDRFYMGGDAKPVGDRFYMEAMRKPVGDRFYMGGVSVGGQRNRAEESHARPTCRSAGSLPRKLG